MAESNGKKAELYLKYIGAGMIIVMGLMSYIFGTAVMRNDSTHAEIKEMILQMSTAQYERTKSIEARMIQFMLTAPPPHIHTGDGHVTKVVP